VRTDQGFSVEVNGHGAGMETAITSRAPGRVTSVNGGASAVTWPPGPRVEGLVTGPRAIGVEAGPVRGGGITNRLTVRAVPRGDACGQWRPASLGAPSRR
jgi:hypothetical protein